MPTYEYACRECGQHLEVAQSLGDDLLGICERCGGPLHKVFSAAGIILKGSGYYVTDTRAARAGSASSSPSSSSSDSSSDGSSSSSTSDSSSSSDSSTGSGASGGSHNSSSASASRSRSA